MAPHARQTILLTGARGLVGWELRRELAPLGDVVAVARAELDLADVDAIRRCVRTVRPTVIVNAAAYTDVDGAERQPDVAYAVNSVAPGVLAVEAERLGAPMLHLSTDYVFDGTKGAPYVESDEPNPLGVYGRSKLEGERAVAAGTRHHLVLRTSWVYGPRGRTFLSRMVRGSDLPDELRAVTNQHSMPTWVRGLAAALAAIVARATADRDGAGEAVARVAGVYHLVSNGPGASPFDFAEAVLARRPSRDGAGGHRLVPALATHAAGGARRPTDTPLDASLAASVLGVRIPDWRDQLDLAIAEG